MSESEPFPNTEGYVGSMATMEAEAWIGMLSPTASTGRTPWMPQDFSATAETLVSMWSVAPAGNPLGHLISTVLHIEPSALVAAMCQGPILEVPLSINKVIKR